MKENDIISIKKEQIKKIILKAERYYEEIEQGNDAIPLQDAIMHCFVSAIEVSNSIFLEYLHSQGNEIRNDTPKEKVIIVVANYLYFDADIISILQKALLIREKMYNDLDIWFEKNSSFIYLTYFKILKYLVE